jgi:hypothetical protein
MPVFTNFDAHTHTYPGLLLWVDAFEWLCLFGILTLTFYSISTTPDNKHIFGRFFPLFGLVIAFLSFVDFVSDLYRLREWSVFSGFSMFISIVNTVFLLPAWIIRLGLVLQKSLPNYVEESQDDFYPSERPSSFSSGPPPAALFLPSPTSPVAASSLG